MFGKLFHLITILLPAAGAAVLCAALLTYNPADPSFDVASGQPITNALGIFGANISEGLIQYFGLCAPLLGFILLFWSFHFWRKEPSSLGSLVLFIVIRSILCLIFLCLCTTFLAELVDLIPHWILRRVTWPQAQISAGGTVGAFFNNGLFNLAFHSFPNHIMRALFGILFALGLATFLTFLLAIALLPADYRLIWDKTRHFLWQALCLPVVLLGFVTHVIVAYFRSLPRHDMAHDEPAIQLKEAAPEEPSHDGDAVYEGSLTPEEDDVTPQREERGAEVIPFPSESAPEKKPQSSFLNPQRFLSSLRGKKEEKTVRVVHSHEPTEENWVYPPLDLLTPPPPQDLVQMSEEEMQGVAEHIEQILADFGVKGKITGCKTGPVVTLYEFEPERGIRIQRVVGLADDLARPLCVSSVRIAPVPRRTVIGIEVPNAHRKTVYLAELFSSSVWKETKAHLPLALGQDIMGEPVIADLAQMPHLLVAGTTGSGKSVGVNAMILSLLNKLSPQQCRLVLVDPKVLEFSLYGDIPHLLTPVITDTGKAINALKWLVTDMDRRYEKMNKLQVRNIEGYNRRVEELQRRGEPVKRSVIVGYDENNRPIKREKILSFEYLPYIVVIIDEAAELMSIAGKEISVCIQRLCQKARAAGIHIIMATQRPSVDVITGVIKANFPARIAFQVGQKVDSRTILGTGGAERLLGRGDMLFMKNGTNITRVHGPFVSDEEVERTVSFLREEEEPQYVEGVTDTDDEDDDAPEEGQKDGNNRNDPVYEEAVGLVRSQNKASASFLQSYFQIGWSRASRLILWMEQDGVISEKTQSGKRRVLMQNTTPPSLHDETGNEPID